MAKLQQLRDYHYEATMKVSENTRTFALAAIAIVWLFRIQSGQAHSIPIGLKWPLILSILSLAIDFLQYLYKDIIWHIVFRKGEKILDKDINKENIELYVSTWLNVPSYCLYYLKVLMLGAAYYKMLLFFINTIIWN